MKTLYVQPELEIVKFHMEDVMDMSNYNTDEDETPMIPPNNA